MAMDYQQLLDQCVLISNAAGVKIMEIYQKDFEIVEKSDQSPLTEADLASHHCIVAGLKAISSLPILSEESADIDWNTRKQWQSYWLIDPLDGTKEFIKKNGEFTVNIALIENGEPTLGVVYAPALDVTYFGAVSLGASKQDASGDTIKIAPKSTSTESLKIVGSRSHQSPEIQGYLDSLDKPCELVAMGSSLKLCLVAEGAADLYPRLGPTSEWDTGAAHAVVNAAGGRVTVMHQNPNTSVYEDSGSVLQYNQKESILNPYFLVSA